MSYTGPEQKTVSQEQYERLIVNMDLQKEINNTFNYIEMKRRKKIENVLVKAYEAKGAYAIFIKVGKTEVWTSCEEKSSSRERERTR